MKCISRQNLTHRQIDNMLTFGFNIGCTLTRILKKDMFSQKLLKNGHICLSNKLDFLD